MKRTIDLAVAAGRKRQSSRTRFVHHFAADEQVMDTIPIFENVCFALSLFRQRSIESILEGKELLERLLAFQNEEGNFPTYLHDFPRCYDPWMGLRIAPALVQILRAFGAGLGAESKSKIQSALERLMQFSASRDRPPIWEHRYQKLQGNEASFSPNTPEEWFLWLVTEQLGLSPILAEISYQPTLQAFIGGSEIQERGEPRPYPIEWILAEKQGFSERLLRDHPAVLSASLLFPLEAPKIFPPASFSLIREKVRLLWGGSKLHSLSAPGGQWAGPGKVTFELGHLPEMEKGDLIEAAFFCDLSSETEITIGGRKATVFYLGDSIQIQTPSLSIELRFNLARGEGDFCGQISRSNRPAQIACKGSFLYEAFDWKIALRTLRRSSDVLISVDFNFSSYIKPNK